MKITKLSTRSFRTGFSPLALVWLMGCLTAGAMLIAKAAPSTAEQDANVVAISDSPKYVTKNIEDIQVGDYVLAEDPGDSVPPTPHKVIALPRNWTEHVVHVQVGNDGELQATREHPFWLPRTGWTAAKDLRVGDYVEDAQGRLSSVTGVRIEARTTNTYNLIVDGVHTYYAMAGDEPVLVHNGWGSYTNTHASGTVYIGKGDASRAAQSGAEKAAQYGDPLVNTDWSPGANDEDSFLQEEFRLRDAEANGLSTYNKINSPGNKLAQNYGCP